MKNVAFSQFKKRQKLTFSNETFACILFEIYYPFLKPQNKRIRLSSYHHCPEWQNKSITLGQKRQVFSRLAKWL